MNPNDPDLVHWRSLPERRQALEFTAQGWALAEACALLGEYEKPQALIVYMLSHIISGLVEEGANGGPELNIEWQVKDGLTATVAFQTDALKALSGVCNMEVGEMQSAIQASLELSLLETYDEHKDKQQLH